MRFIFQKRCTWLDNPSIKKKTDRFDGLKYKITNNAKPITLADVWGDEEKKSTPWYRRANFLSEYIYALLNANIVSDTRVYKSDAMEKFLFNNTVDSVTCSEFIEDGFLDQTQEIIICEIKNLQATIAFTNIALYTLYVDKVRIPYNEIDGVQIDTKTHRVDVYYSDDKCHRMFYETLANPILIKIFLKVAAGKYGFILTERDIINNPAIRLTSIGGKTVGERMKVDML